MPFLNKISCATALPIDGNNPLNKHCFNTSKWMVGFQSLADTGNLLILALYLKCWVNRKIPQKHIITILVAQNMYVSNLNFMADAPFHCFCQYLEEFNILQAGYVLAVWFETQFWLWWLIPNRKWGITWEPETPLNLEKSLNLWPKETCG